MATIEKIAAQTGVPLRHLVKLHKAGFLIAEAPDEFALKFAESMRRGNPLSVAQRLYAIHRNFKLSAHLEPYHEKIVDSVEALGDIESQGAPWSLAQRIEGAAGDDPADIEALALWARQTLDTLPKSRTVDHAWLACRMLLNVPEIHIDRMLRKWWKVSRLIRAHSALADCWQKEGGKIRYHKPRMKFDI